MTMTASVLPERMIEIDEPQPQSFAARLGQVRSTIPACTHVDGSARVQTVDRDRNPRFHELLTAFHERTGCPVLINTSFNRAGEPIVRTPADALRCFVAAELDLLIIERCAIARSAVTSAAVA
jgi:carbamoyltransferase